MPTYIARSLWPDVGGANQARLHVGSNAFDSVVAQRPQHDKRSNSEELVGAALAGEYALALGAILSELGVRVDAVHTVAAVDAWHHDDDHTIPRIVLTTHVTAVNLSRQQLDATADAALKRCPVLKALQGTSIRIFTQLA